MNTRLEYLDRDGSNYERFGSMVFRGVASESAKATLMKALESAEFFIADQVRLPELFFEDRMDSDDHCFHEIASIAPAGWNAFDPAARDSARR